MNVGPTELLAGLLCLAIPIVIVVAIVLLVRAGKQPCPACRKRISKKASICPHCATQLTRS